MFLCKRVVVLSNANHPIFRFEKRVVVLSNANHPIFRFEKEFFHPELSSSTFRVEAKLKDRPHRPLKDKPSDGIY